MSDSTLITMSRKTFRKFIKESYERGKADALKEKHSKTYKEADIGGMAYKANIVFDEEEEKDEQQSKQTD